MADRFQTDQPDPFPTDRRNGSSPIDIRLHPRLPQWLARHLLRPDEQITWVRGARWNPGWERYLTSPKLVFLALVPAVALIVAGVTRRESRPELLPVLALVAGGLVIGSLFVVGFCAGYFTRLVVTNFRIFIVQGHEICRSWSISNLPRSLIRHAWQGRETASPTVDLEALQSMLGGPSDQFADSKLIMAFGKHLDGIKARKKGQP